MLPTDIALITDPIFAHVVTEYVENEKVFFEDFANAYGKLLQLGCPEGETASAPAGCPFMAKSSGSADFRDQAMHGSIEHCRTAVEAGADVHALEKNSGRNALHKACFWNHMHMMSWMIEDLKINVNCQDYSGDTPLHDAARFGHNSIVTGLLNGCANTEITNKDGKTAADVAVDYGKHETAALIKRGAEGGLPGAV